MCHVAPRNTLPSALKMDMQALGTALGSWPLLQEGVWQKVSATDLPSFEGVQAWAWLGDSRRERHADTPENSKPSPHRIACEELKLVGNSIGDLGAKARGGLLTRCGQEVSEFGE